MNFVAKRPFSLATGSVAAIFRLPTLKYLLNGRWFRDIPSRPWFTRLKLSLTAAMCQIQEASNPILSELLAELPFPNPHFQNLTTSTYSARTFSIKKVDACYSCLFFIGAMRCSAMEIDTGCIKCSTDLLLRSRCGVLVFHHPWICEWMWLAVNDRVIKYIAIICAMVSLAFQMFCPLRRSLLVPNFHLDFNGSNCIVNEQIDHWNNFSAVFRSKAQIKLYWSIIMLEASSCSYTILPWLIPSDTRTIN